MQPFMKSMNWIIPVPLPSHVESTKISEHVVIHEQYQQKQQESIVSQVSTCLQTGNEQHF